MRLSWFVVAVLAQTALQSAIIVQLVLEAPLLQRVLQPRAVMQLVVGYHITVLGLLRSDLVTTNHCSQI